MNNVNDTYFDGHYKDIWRSLIPAELTVKETDFMIQYFNLQQGDKVLDIMCGYGRHAIALAKKGITVNAIDNLDDYIDEIKATAANESLPINVEKANVIGFEAKEMVDLAICMGNSICFFNRADTIRLMKMISKNLRPGGHFLINTWTIAEISFNNFQQRSWNQVGDTKFLISSKYFLQPSRIETDHVMIFEDGNTEVKKAIDYIYSLAETESMLLETGLVIKDVFSIPGKKIFSLGDPRAYIIAEKISN